MFHPLKMKYDEMSANVNKFNKGKTNLNDLLKYQHPANHRQGLGYSKKNVPKPSLTPSSSGKTNVCQTTEEELLHLMNTRNTKSIISSLHKEMILT